MALSKPRNTKQLGVPPGVIPALLSVPIADNVKIYPGALVVLDGGYAAPATAASGKIAIGRCTSGGPGHSGVTVYDNTGTGHAAGAFEVPVEPGCFKWVNKSTDALAQANVGGPAWIEDDCTVRETATSTSAAGRVVRVESDGVWVLTLPGLDTGATVVAAEAAHQADSTAADVAGVVADFNALLAKLQAAGLMA